MRFNQLSKPKNRLRNHEGAEAYRLNPALELYSLVVTSSLSDTFYEKGSDRIDRLRSLIGQNEPGFVAQLAVYAREKMHLRSVPLVLAVELAKIHNGSPLLSRLVARIVQRADEITELLAYYQLANAREEVKKLNRLSKQIQKGLGRAFNKFDEYQFAKYNRNTEVSLKDALFLVHPKAEDEAQQSLFNKIVNDSLEVPYTWEVELSVLGQQNFANDKARNLTIRAKWEELVESGKLGYMALMRNLRNLLQVGVSTQVIQQVAERLGDPRQVARSRQLPFRFLAAYREIKGIVSVNTSLVLHGLEQAMRASAQNLKGFDKDTRVLIACDTSSSMWGPVSRKSSVRMYDIGLVLGMILHARTEAVITGIFGDRWKVINLPQGNILANTQKLDQYEGEVGYATNGHLVIRDLRKRKLVMDKVMIFTDMQLWNSRNDGNSLAQEWQKYRKIAPEAKLYLFDLQGYGQAPLNVLDQGVYLIAGWSDKVFDVMEAIEQGKQALSELRKIDV